MTSPGVVGGQLALDTLWDFDCDYCPQSSVLPVLSGIKSLSLDSLFLPRSISQ